MARNYPFAEAPASPTRASYAADAIHTFHRVVKADIPKVDSMRAPGEAIGTLTYETAIDELAEMCGVDPVEFRILNEPTQDPTSGHAFADRRLLDCIRTGAAKFGLVRPGQTRQPNGGTASSSGGEWPSPFAPIRSALHRRKSNWLPMADLLRDWT